MNNYVSAVEKGGSLEKSFFDYLKNQTNFGGYKKENCKLHYKKKYYSKIRNSYISTDVSLEVYNNINDQQYSLLIIFECKNYNGTVPVDRVAKFSHDLNEIGQHNTKGIIVSCSNLQKSAFQTAKNLGIGLIKYKENGIEWVLNRSSKSFLNDELIKNLMLIANHNLKEIRFACFYNGIFFDCIHKILESIISGKSYKHKESNDNNQIQKINRSTIINIANFLLKKVNYEEGKVPLQKICDYLKNERGISINYVNDYRFDENNNEILGSADFNKKEITIFCGVIRNIGRERFMLCHEIGHFVLSHSKFISWELLLEKDLNTSDNKSNNFIRKMERQANYFASCILMPEKSVKNELIKLLFDLEIVNRGFGAIYLDDQPSNMQNYNIILESLSDIFQVSKYAMEIKLKELGLLNDNRKHMQNLGILIKDFL